MCAWLLCVWRLSLPRFFVDGVRHRLFSVLKIVACTSVCAFSSQQSQGFLVGVDVTVSVWGFSISNALSNSTTTARQALHRIF